MGKGRKKFRGSRSANKEYQELVSARDKASQRLLGYLRGQRYRWGQPRFRRQYGANTPQQAHKAMETGIKHQSRGRGTKKISQQIRMLSLPPKHFQNHTTLNFQSHDGSTIEANTETSCSSQDTSRRYEWVEKPHSIAIQHILNLVALYNFTRVGSDNMPTIANTTHFHLSDHYDYLDEACKQAINLDLSLVDMPHNIIQGLLERIKEAFDDIEQQTYQYCDQVEDEWQKALIAVIVSVVSILGFSAWVSTGCPRPNCQASVNRLPEHSLNTRQEASLEARLHRLANDEQIPQETRSNLERMQGFYSDQAQSFLKGLQDDEIKALAQLPSEHLNLTLMQHVKQYADRYDINLTDLTHRVEQNLGRSETPQNHLKSLSQLMETHYPSDPQESSQEPSNHYLQGMFNRYLQDLIVGQETMTQSVFVGFDNDAILPVYREKPAKLTLKDLQNQVIILREEPGDQPRSSDRVVSMSATRLQNHPETRQPCVFVKWKEGHVDLNTINTLVLLKSIFDDDKPALTDDQFRLVMDKKDEIQNDPVKLYSVLDGSSNTPYTEEGLQQIYPSYHQAQEGKQTSRNLVSRCRSCFMGCFDKRGDEYHRLKGESQPRSIEMV